MQQRFFFGFVILASALLAFSSTAIAQNVFPDELKTREPKTIEEVKLLEQHVQALIEKVSPATVSVGGGGTGVVINDEGLIMTVAHVNVSAGRRVRITFPDGKRVWGETLGNYHPLDAGLIQITSEGEFPFVEMGEAGNRDRGEWCLAIGYPVSYSRGRQPAARLGRVLNSGSRTIMTDCTIMGGDSGGPLFDLDGKVIGISSRVSGSLMQNFHVPLSVFESYWDRMLEGEDIRTSRDRRRPRNRGYLGIRGDTEATPAIIEEVVRGSAAEKAGLKVGDEVVEVNDVKITDFASIGEQFSDKKPQDSITIMIRRDGELIKMTIELGG